MLSKEHAMHQEMDLGRRALYVAKTQALLREEAEDEIVLSKYFPGAHCHSIEMLSSL